MDSSRRWPRAEGNLPDYCAQQSWKELQTASNILGAATLGNLSWYLETEFDTWNDKQSIELYLVLNKTKQNIFRSNFGLFTMILSPSNRGAQTLKDKWAR
jgi:hypothetical protein